MIKMMKMMKKLFAAVLCITLFAAVFTAPVLAAADTVSAAPTASKVTVNGKNVAFSAYNIGGSNYFKLRDIAFALNGTAKQFEVSYDAAKNAVALTNGKAYTKVGGEMAAAESGKKTAAKASAKIYIDGDEVTMDAYNIGGNNYFKLREIGQLLQFSVDYDSAANTILIDTSKTYMYMLANQYKIIIDGKNVTQDMTLIESSRYGTVVEAASYFKAFQLDGHPIYYSKFEYDEELKQYAAFVYSWFSDEVVYKMPILGYTVYRYYSGTDDTYDKYQLAEPIIGSEAEGAWLPLRAVSEFLDWENNDYGIKVKIEAK